MPEVNDFSQAKNVLGLYKAEWLNGRLFDFFNEPGYFKELMTGRPCVLIGGRGTGKTTVLRGLSYQGQFALNEEDTSKIREWPFFGLYLRINTNRVTAFRGPEISEDKWVAYFAHYMNLCFCQLMLDFSLWHEEKTGEAIEIREKDWRRVLTTLHLQGVDSLSDLAEEVEILILEFEASINTIIDSPPENITMQGAPLDALSKALISSPQLKGRQFFFLLDEFENFEDYQQRLLNTIIKHSNSEYTFKVGVRELGWRQRATLNKNEQLTSPADYAKINISEVLKPSIFKEFAKNVVESRLNFAFSGSQHERITVHGLLPELSDSEEADILVGSRYKALVEELEKALSSEDLVKAKDIRPGHLFFIKYWAENNNKESFPEGVLKWLNDPGEWKHRVTNHFYSSMFTMRKGKRGIRKYYSGWDTYLGLANGNIRYLLELVHAAILRQSEESGDVISQVSHELQTKAAEDVGRKNLSELEGLSVDGAKLTKLLLSLGRVFQVLAADPGGHTPEVNQFYLQGNESGSDNRVKSILDQAVMHLALVRQPGNKLTDETDTREYDYMVHPIFAPFFVFSHRRKRKIGISGDMVIMLVESPRDAIKEILDRNNRFEEVSLPDQLQLFGSYYAESK